LKGDGTGQIHAEQRKTSRYGLASNERRWGCLGLVQRVVTESVAWWMWLLASPA